MRASSSLAGPLAHACVQGDATTQSLYCGAPAQGVQWQGIGAGNYGSKMLEIDKDDFINVKIDKAKKISAYVFLKTVGIKDHDIFNKLDHPEYFQKTFKEHKDISLEDAFLELHNNLNLLLQNQD